MDIVVVEKLTCGHCEEEYEESFFCENCSGIHDSGGETETVPNIFYDGNQDDEYIEKDIEPFHQDICFNCCFCRGRK